jgi:geranylgeranyl pyrophosphate synthase
MDFINFAKDTRADIEKTLRLRVSSQSDGEILWKLLEGGKRLRPLLCVLSFRACGGSDENYENALDVAAAVELGHCASLCHDDIVDRDLTRRGKPALWVGEGIPEALIAGHRAISLGLQISLSHGPEIANTFLEAWDRALVGGLMEAGARKNQRVSSADYLKINVEKTASLFSAATKAGAQMAHAPLALQRSMEEYGMAVGTAYQIADDISELHDGRVGEISSMMGLPGRTSEMEPLKEFLEGKMEETIKRAENLSQEDGIPVSDFKQMLGHVPRYFAGQILGKKP